MWILNVDQICFALIMKRVKANILAFELDYFQVEDLQFHNIE